MNYRRLGRTGLQVSEIGLGMWGMGGWSGGSESDVDAALTQSISGGINFFDTAWAYGEGKSDRLLGRLISETSDRSQIVAASKIPPANRKWPGDPRDSYDDVFPEAHVRACAENIRRALGRETIDVLQLHVWDDSWVESRAFTKTVEALKRERVISWFGISLNRWEPWNGIRAIRTGVVDVVQVIYNIFDQAPEDELFPECRKHDVGVIARVPLDEGSLGGKLTRDTRFPADDWRANYFGPANLGPTVDRIEKLKAELPANITLPQLALRFILSNDDVATTIVGMRTPPHVRENLSCSTDGPLPSDLIARLRKHRWDRKAAPWAS